MAHQRLPRSTHMRYRLSQNETPLLIGDPRAAGSRSTSRSHTGPPAFTNRSWSPERRAIFGVGCHDPSMAPEVPHPPVYLLNT